MTPQRYLRRGVPALVLALIAALGSSGPVVAAPTYPFQNPRLPRNARVTDLMGRLTLDEKLSLLHQSQAAVPRLGIPYFKAGTEALHGVAWSNDITNNWNKTDAKGTVFPQAVGLASTWDTPLISQVGSAVGDEARGYNALNPSLWGLNLWAPVVNLLRDPRWGRNEEGYSEDPALTGAISTAYGSGIEGDNPVYLKAAPTLKHYLAYDNEANREVTSSNVPPRVLNEYDRQAFAPAIAAGDEVVQMYTHQRTSRDKQPLQQLRAFQRVTLAPGQTRTVRFTLPVAELAHWDVTRSRWVVESSDYDVMVGASSSDVRQRAALRVRGETIPPRDLSRPTPAQNFDAYSGVQLVDRSKAAGTAVGAVAAGDWIAFADSALRPGAATFTASVAKATAGTGTIQVRLDSPNGPLLGTATVSGTGDAYAYATTTTELTSVSGRHDVYLVFGSDMRLSGFSVG